MSEPLTGRTIVCLATIDWDFLWQSHQEIMSRFARAGNLVLFVENTGVRNLRWRDFRRVAWRLRQWLGDSAGPPRAPVPGVIVVAPILLPFPRSRLAALINRRIMLPRLARRLVALGARDPVIFSYLPTPNALRLVELLRSRRSVVVYYCNSDFRELSDLGPTLVESENALVRRSDLVFVQGAEFVRRFAPLNPRVHTFHNGVNLEVFDRGRVQGPAPELAGLPRPILGYSGGLHSHFDFALVARLARAYPTGSVVLVGPRQMDAGEAGRLANVHFLGTRTRDELPALVGAFDVALVPYVRTTFTHSVNPTKLYEYLAMGCPVVTTELPAVRDLALPDWAVRVTPTSEAFIAAVDAALHEEPDLRDARAALVVDEDWGAITRRMSDLIAERAAANAAES